MTMFYTLEVVFGHLHVDNKPISTCIHTPNFSTTVAVRQLEVRHMRKSDDTPNSIEDIYICPEFEKEGWEPRKKLLRELFSFAVVGGSIVPTDPTLEQTFYLKTGYLEMEDFEQGYQYLYKDIGPRELEFNPVDQTLLGFVFPFPEFEVTSYKNDTRVLSPKVDVRDPQNKERTLNTFYRTAPREKCEAIWEAFCEDPHSKELAFYIIDTGAPQPVKRIHLLKS